MVIDGVSEATWEQACAVWVVPKKEIIWCCYVENHLFDNRINCSWGPDPLCRL
jgi:hypothetical protein